MLTVLRRLAARLRPLQGGHAHGSPERSPDNVDALASAVDHGRARGHQIGTSTNAPPNWVKSYDDGRPRT